MSNDPLDGYLCEKYLLFPHFSFFFWFSNMILSDSLILPVSQLQTHRILNTHLLHSIAHL